MPRGELQLAQHGGDVRLDGLDRDEQLRGDLLVGVAAGDQPHDLLLARREAVELGVGDGRLPGTVLLWVGALVVVGWAAGLIRHAQRRTSH